MYEAYYEVDHEANDAYLNMLHKACFKASIVVCKSLVQFSSFSEFGEENTQISLKFGSK